MIFLIPFVLLLCSTPCAGQAREDSLRQKLYQYAWDRLMAEQDAEVNDDEKICFKGIDSVGVLVSIDDDIVKILSEQRARDRFELILRGHGVPVSETISSDLDLMLSVSAVWDKKERFLSYTLSVTIYEPLIFYRDERPHKRFVALWQDLSFGHAGRDVARRSFLASIEEKAERVANLYLSANKSAGIVKSD